jgi:ankyrin repeat protein
MATAFTKVLLLKGAAADTWAPSGLSALMISAATNKIDIMELLIMNQGAGTCSASRATDAPTPVECGLHRNGGKQHGSPLQLDGADVRLLDGQKRTALMHAASNDHIEAIELLLAHGAQVRLPSVPSCLEDESTLCCPLFVCLPYV